MTKNKIILGIIVCGLFVVLGCFMSVLEVKKLVIQKDITSVSWTEVEIFASQCDIKELAQGHGGGGVVLKDGRGFTIVGSPGSSAMTQLMLSAKSKCGTFSVGVE